MPKGLSGSTTVGNFKIDYYEIKESAGGGPRGLNVTLEGHEKSKFDFYPISPNPHDNPSYNKDQANFYLEAAKFVGKDFTFAADDVTCPHPDVPQNPQPAEMDKLIANDLGKHLSSKKWQQMTKPEQKTFLSAYKKARDDWKTKAAKTQAAKEWTTHVKAVGGKSFTWKSITYKFPAAAAAS